MKIRKLKRLHNARTAHGLRYRNFYRWHDPYIIGILKLTQEEERDMEKQRAEELDRLFEEIKMNIGSTAEEVEAAKQEFVVVKKSTGEVVATFDLKEDAEAMIEKAKRQKKAALVLLDTNNP